MIHQKNTAILVSLVLILGMVAPIFPVVAVRAQSNGVLNTVTPVYSPSQPLNTAITSLNLTEMNDCNGYTPENSTTNTITPVYSPSQSYNATIASFSPFYDNVTSLDYYNATITSVNVAFFTCPATTEPPYGPQSEWLNFTLTVEFSPLNNSEPTSILQRWSGYMRLLHPGWPPVVQVDDLILSNSTLSLAVNYDNSSYIPAGNLTFIYPGAMVVGPKTVYIPWSGGVPPQASCYIQSAEEIQTLSFNGTNVNPNVTVKSVTFGNSVCLEYSQDIWRPSSQIPAPPTVNLTILSSTPRDTVVNLDWENLTFGGNTGFDVRQLERMNNGSNVFQIAKGSNVSVIFPKVVGQEVIASPQLVEMNNITQNVTIGASYGIPWWVILIAALVVVGASGFILRREHKKHMYMIDFFRHRDEEGGQR